jgi:hypothetical protein
MRLNGRKDNNMNLNKLFDTLHVNVDYFNAEEIKEACEMIIRVQAMTGDEQDVINSAFKTGPLWDGDVPSKSGRDTLLWDGFISKVVVKGEEGYNALTYKGSSAYRLLKAMKESKNENI